MNAEQKYQAIEAKTDKLLTHLVHLKWTAAIIAGALLIDLWLIL